VAPEEGAGLEATLELVRRRIVRNSVLVAHPQCAAHLHCPPLLAALAPRRSSRPPTNRSTRGTRRPPPRTSRRRLITWLTDEYGLGPRADGVFTSGGTQSNLMGLLLARDRAAARAASRSPRTASPRRARRFPHRLLRRPRTSRCASRPRILGLGDRSVVEVTADEHGRLDPARVDAVLESIEDVGLIPIALVATAGTTDLGAIDPLAALAPLADEFGVLVARRRRRSAARSC
jgi:L-2,4-diaminobutyrate decarboxylase